MTKPFRIILLCAVVGISFGCATKSELHQVAAEAKAASDAAHAAARNAQSTADQANSRASSAEDRADNASSAADRALQVAEDSQTCCTETNEKINRMFKRSMYK